MALEAIVSQQEPFIYGCNDYSYNMGSYDRFILEGSRNTVSSPENISATITAGDMVFAGTASSSRRKRRRTTTAKNKEEMENQRMTHIATERNRRRQMNDYLAVIRSLMPPSYAQRGDQASIVGGAINFVKELEQLLQFLEAHKANKTQSSNINHLSSFFTFPQYTTSPRHHHHDDPSSCNNNSMDVADIEVTMVDTHANIKILTERRPKQLLKMVLGFQSLGLTILHLNVTAVDQRSVLYTYSVKVEDDDCRLTTVNEIATAVHDIVVMIQRETTLMSMPV